MSGITAAPVALRQVILVRYPKEEKHPVWEEPPGILVSSVHLPQNLKIPILKDHV